MKQKLMQNVYLGPALSTVATILGVWGNWGTWWVVALLLALWVAVVATTARLLVLRREVERRRLQTEAALRAARAQVMGDRLEAQLRADFPRYDDKQG